MEEKNRIEEYIIKMYDIYYKNNFKYFVEKCLNYNIKIGNYKKYLFENTKKIFYKIIALLPENKAKIKYQELKLFYKLDVFNFESTQINNNIILDIPVFEENEEKILTKILTYCIENNINFTIRINKILINPLFQIIIYNVFDAKKITDFFLNDKDISKEVKSRSLPFLFQKNLIAIYTEIKPYNFKNFYIVNLYKYYSKIKTKDEVSLNSFLIYVEREYKNEKRINKKRMYLILYKYLDIINNMKDIFSLFDTNSIMNIGSIDISEYSIKLDENGIISLYNKIDNSIINYESEDFLNAIYSKYYENIMKKAQNSKYFNMFYEKYDEILTSNYKNIDILLDLLNNDMDNINKQLILISSAYYANKKMNIPEKQLYIILDNILDKINNNIKNNTENDPLYILNDDYASKIVNLKNGTPTTIKDYLLNNKVIENIPNNCIIHLKNNEIISGKKFIDNIYKYVDQFDNYNELVKKLIDIIEYK